MNTRDQQFANNSPKGGLSKKFDNSTVQKSPSYEMSELPPKKP